mgnify:CR=1 FL=1
METLPEQWKHSDLPQKQLGLNTHQLANQSSYPEHWTSFLTLIRKVDTTNHTLYDIGCGVGSTYKLLLDNKVSVKYVGLDFSDAMIETAKKTWNYPEFYVRDFYNTEFDFSNQILYCNGLLDILPDGLAALTKLLTFESKYVFLNRLNFGHEGVETYVAYETIRCIRYSFDYEKFMDVVRKHNYTLTHDGSCILLKKAN